MTRYQYVPSYCSLLSEGSYSWWGIQEEPEQESRYGGHMFTTSFPNILEQFRQAHATIISALAPAGGSEGVQRNGYG